MSSETAAIEKTLWTYLDGLHEGDADKIAQAFHPVSHLYSETNGIADVPRDNARHGSIAPVRKVQGLPRQIACYDDQSGLFGLRQSRICPAAALLCGLSAAAQDKTFGACPRLQDETR